jgi:hypothetical protein
MVKGLVAACVLAALVVPSATAAPDPLARNMAKSALSQAKAANATADAARNAVGATNQNVSELADITQCTWAIQQDFNVGMLKLWSLLIDGNEGGPYTRADDGGSCQRVGVTRSALAFQAQTPASLAAATAAYNAGVAVAPTHSGGLDARGGHHCWTSCGARGMYRGQYHCHRAPCGRSDIRRHRNHGH